LKEIRGDAKNIRALLSGAKYAIDYYQREYRWETKHISELIEDLAGKFRESYEASHERAAVEGYGHYFLGSIIISDRDGKKFIIDGQQRLTSLTLLLIFIHRTLSDPEQKTQLSELIFSQKYGKKSFNLDVPERTSCMEALYAGQAFDENGKSESINNILGRYRDIEEQFQNDLRTGALPFFADWLLENVHLVEITAYSDEDAYTIFETMNDRGLSLTPTDMLKGYLLANITDDELRNRTSKVWRERIWDTVLGVGGQEEAPVIFDFPPLRRSRYGGQGGLRFTRKPGFFDILIKDTRCEVWVSAAPAGACSDGGVPPCAASAFARKLRRTS
jgi:uncharacterized protein with ParB-like and HNH nuclease domain